MGKPLQITVDERVYRQIIPSDDGRETFVPVSKESNFYWGGEECTLTMQKVIVTATTRLRVSKRLARTYLPAAEYTPGIVLDEKILPSVERMLREDIVEMKKVNPEVVRMNGIYLVDGLVERIHLDVKCIGEKSFRRIPYSAEESVRFVLCHYTPVEGEYVAEFN